MNRNVRIELSTSQEDWKVVRECYVQSFHRYPLYKYMIPDDNKRNAFLRAYLDANYDVTVGSGEGILLVMRICENENNNSNSRIGGGVVFVPPSRDGHGWAITDDEPYWEAYEKHGLAKISAEGFERVKRYEAWENNNICRKLSGSRIPMWNGLFCAMLPEHTSRGLGSSLYKEAIKIMAEYWLKKSIQQKKETQDTGNGFFSRLFSGNGSNYLHYFTLLNHRKLPTAQAVSIKSAEPERCTKSPQNKSTLHKSMKEMMGNPTAPVVIAISHSEKAAHFHEANGFHPITRLPYFDPVEETPPFYTHVLVLDPFRTGKVNICKEALATSKPAKIPN
uniref:N-acetyltransferase domain-containing protein n=2 Tax=Ciona intestinalis TaxID=7719 RepID=F6XPN3_CIOIN